MDVITIQDLHKSYNREIHAVQGLDLAIHKGEVYGFLGPNGAGKSTTIKMITGLIRPSSGNITILGNEMPKEMVIIKPKIGYVPQDLIFYSHLSVKENLILFATMYEIEKYNSKIEYLLDLLQIKNIEKRRSDKLSGGQKRRLNLAIGLLNEPEILILDEPSAGMDPQSRNILWESIRNIAENQNVTIILTTHLMETVDRVADRVGIIDNGKIIAEGTPQELKAKYGKGDILEIEFNDHHNVEVANLSDKLKSLSTDVIVSNYENMIKCSMQNILQIFSSIVSLIEEEVGKEAIKKIVMHENTLEDVFIQLTGRELRE